MSPPAGMGEDWLPSRDRAEQTIYKPDPPAPDQQKPPASATASESASIIASKADEGSSSAVKSGAPADTTPPPPPPTRRGPGRVQFNHRILPDRDRLLQKYKNKHDTTMQKIVDQMVDEYLDRRGLLPKDD